MISDASFVCFFIFTNLANYILLGSTIILVSVVVFKFLAALQFASKKEPEDNDKYGIVLTK